MIGRSNTNINTDDNSEYNRLKVALVANYPISEEVIDQIPNFSFEMSFNKISAQRILDELEARLLTDGNSISDINIREYLNNAISSMVNSNKEKGNKKKAGAPIKTKETNNNFNLNNKPQDGMIIDSINSLNCELKFDILTSYNEKGQPEARTFNSKYINYNCFHNNEINEYDLVPKDDDIYYEEYLKYFEDVKNNFYKEIVSQEALNILENDKFVLLVTFDNTEGKPSSFNDIIVIDPLKNFERSQLRIDNNAAAFKDYYFFNGQIIYVEGNRKNGEIYANRIVFGITPTSYSLEEPYLRSFFEEAEPYSIFAVNGPILNKTDLDLSIFKGTMEYLAKQNPHAVILNGPFLNVDNEIIQSGKLTGDGNSKFMNYFEFFEKIMIDVAKLFADKKTTIIITPSLSDATTFYPLPQPPFNISNFKTLSNQEIVKREQVSNNLF
jgi:hypothetical protein